MFVTHDIDEAIKMGHRIAILRDGELVQYDTPDNILAEPANDFVADFVGADRGLKRLNVWRLGDLELDPPPDEPDGPTATERHEPARRALAHAGGGEGAARGGGRGRPADRHRGARFDNAPDRPRREGGRAMMLAGAHAAPIAQGPVIPHYERASNCIRENGQFCFSWFVDNFDRVFVPRLVEHIWLTLLAVGIGFVIAFTAALVAYTLDWFETPFAIFAAFLYTIPSLAFFQLLVPITGLDGHERRDRARVLHDADPVPQHAHGAARGTRGRPIGGARDGPHQGADPAPRRASAGAPGDHGRASGSRP